VDKSKLLSLDNWLTGISIQKWVFRPKEPVQHEGGGAIVDNINIISSNSALITVNLTSDRGGAGVGAQLLETAGRRARGGGEVRVGEEADNGGVNFE